MSHRPQILCISLSPITGDSRVLRQISVLAEFGDVTTIGFGPKPEQATSHIEVPAGLATLPQTVGGVALLAARQWKRAELKAPAIAFALAALEDKKFDLVVANEARVLALADRVAHGAPIWADMHEWAPEERTHILSWRILVAPLMTHLCKTYLPRATAVTAVCGSIADLYLKNFGVPTAVMRNSGPWRDLSPQPVDPEHIRLVHSGAAVAGRDLEGMIDVVKRLDERYTLDVYLVPGGDGGAYLQSLKDRAADCPRIQFKAPVAPDALPATLNAYDVGVFWIPPTHTNARLTLPNKFFDYLQARLAIAIGPSIEMERLVNEYKLGVVSTDFTVEACLASLATFEVDQIVAAKKAADASARVLSFDADAEVAREILRGALNAG
jgi:hypothetical protein